MPKRRHPGRVALCFLAVWVTILTGTYLLLNAAPELQAWADRQVPAIASLRDWVRTIVHRDYLE